MDREELLENEKYLTEENKRKFSDIIVYLEASGKLDEDKINEVGNDLINIMINDQKSETVFNGEESFDVAAYCTQIIDSVEQKTVALRVIEYVQLFCFSTIVFLVYNLLFTYKSKIVEIKITDVALYVVWTVFILVTVINLKKILINKKSMLICVLAFMLFVTVNVFITSIESVVIASINRFVTIAVPTLVLIIMTILEKVYKGKNNERIK